MTADQIHQPGGTDVLLDRDHELETLIARGEAEAFEASKQAALHALRRELRTETVADMRARNVRRFTPSSRDGTFGQPFEGLAIDLSSQAGALYGPGFCEGNIMVTGAERPLSEDAISACGEVALRQPVQVEYLHPYWFLG